MSRYPISFRVSREEIDVIAKIAERAAQMAARYDSEYKVMTAHMDVTACHANGCPLCLGMLLAADDGDFAHDVFGIRNHIDRKTGKLQDSFLPRYAQFFHRRHDDNEGAQA